MIDNNVINLLITKFEFGYKISFFFIPSDKDYQKITCISFPPYFVSKKERKNPKILNASRRQRIAKGSGNKVQDINRFIEQFTEMQKMMKSMMNGNGKYPKIPGMNNLFK